jgi:hypothetical protein
VSGSHPDDTLQVLVHQKTGKRVRVGRLYAVGIKLGGWKIA